ncbi:MAG: gamma carbonic anhydrase family protein [Proteobacteria bacterium]|nr:gamma carbonic anhydrase family protein [Pseudomonadota bacterium]
MSGIIIPYQGIIPEIADTVFIAPNATVIGKVKIGIGSSIWFNTVLRGDVGSISVGTGTNLQDGTVVHVTRERFDTVIGNDVLIGHQALIHGATLEDNCFIGMRATVMDGVVVESGAMVAAGALVTPGKKIKKGEVWAGSPAKFMRNVTAEEAEIFPKQCEGYRKLAEEYRLSLSG